MIEDVFNQTLNLILLHKKYGLAIPFALKGNLGEFIVAGELLKRFPDHRIDYRGGAYPRIDILIDNVRIQVKTQIKHPLKKFKNGELDFESSPTINRSTIEDKECDIIVLVILYFVKDYSRLQKQNLYIFGQEDFKYFSHKFCWTGKSKGDYTIVNVLSVKGTIPDRMREKIDFYNKIEYKRLFQHSKDNWEKITTLL